MLEQQDQGGDKTNKTNKIKATDDVYLLSMDGKITAGRRMLLAAALALYKHTTPRCCLSCTCAGPSCRRQQGDTQLSCAMRLGFLLVRLVDYVNKGMGQDGDYFSLHFRLAGRQEESYKHPTAMQNIHN